MVPGQGFVVCFIFLDQVIQVVKLSFVVFLDQVLNDLSILQRKLRSWLQRLGLRFLHFSQLFPVRVLSGDLTNGFEVRKVAMVHEGVGVVLDAAERQVVAVVTLGVGLIALLFLLFLQVGFILETTIFQAVGALAHFVDFIKAVVELAVCVQFDVDQSLGSDEGLAWHFILVVLDDVDLHDGLPFSLHVLDGLHAFACSFIIVSQQLGKICS